ncbi:hypothetical protein ACP3WT_26815, partial [Salmonella enterica]|uniref:hypothetical protein n=1 Tax=Salmonella enterica TaxID=28901 RepID=UPI003CF88CCA
AEMRFPLIEAMLTPIGVLGGIRGVFFFDVGGAAYNQNPLTFATSKAQDYRPVIGYTFNPVTGGVDPIYGPVQTITGFRLV